MSHQLPVPVVVVVTEIGVDVVEVVVDVGPSTEEVVEVVLTAVVEVVVAAVVVVDELQEANTIEATMRRVSKHQRAPFFTCSSFSI